MAQVCHTRTHTAQLRVVLRLRVADVFLPPEQIQGREGGAKTFCLLSESRNAARLRLRHGTRFNMSLVKRVCAL